MAAHDGLAINLRFVNRAHVNRMSELPTLHEQLR